MKISKRFLFLILVLGAFPFTASAYEVPTHEKMSSRAADASVLGTYALSEIGLGAVGTQTFFGSTIRDLIMYGSNHEDDAPRYVNHFYNPLDGSGYHHFFVGHPSPAWGLEDSTTFVGQDNSWKDLQEYYYGALTSSDQDSRNNFFVETFKSLGYVMHLVEDAGQPQHTRNDSHIPGSLYEKVTNELFDGLEYEEYPPVSFSHVRDYWYTVAPPHRNVNEILAGKGIAEYSNRNFVTTDTNFRWTGNHPTRDPQFPLPEVEPQVPLQVDISALISDPRCGRANPALTGVLTFYGNTVKDSYRGDSDFNKYATTLSIFDTDLQEESFSSPGSFTLNRFNFCHAHPYLIPRAIGYSAGLVNFFFRGRLEVDVSQLGGQLNVTAKNISGSGIALSSGSFEVYYDAKDGTRKRAIGPTSIGSGGLENGATVTLAGSAPSDIDMSNPSPYMVVFRGIVGQEYGVIGRMSETKDKVFLMVKVDLQKWQFAYSQNYGSTWQRVGRFYDSFGEGVYLGKNKFLVSDMTPLPFALYFSSDNLVTLTQIPNTFGTRITDMGQGVLVGQGQGNYDAGCSLPPVPFGNARYVRSIDNGQSWAVFGMPPCDGLNKASPTPFLNITYLGNGRAIAFSLEEPNKTPHLWRSVDKGLSWVDVGSTSILKPYGGIGFVVYLGNDIVVTGNQDGFIYRSTDAGISWNPVFSTGLSGKVFFQTRTAYLGNGVIIALSEDTIYRSVDYGAHWSSERSSLAGVADAIEGLMCVGVGKAVIVGFDTSTSQPAMWLTNDSGVTWIKRGDLPGTDFGLEIFAGEKRNPVLPNLYDN